MPIINQETQTAPFPAELAESEAVMGAQGPGGFMEGFWPGRESEAPWHPQAQCPRCVKSCSTRVVLATPLLPTQLLSARGKGPGGGDGYSRDVPAAGLLQITSVTHI